MLKNCHSWRPRSRRMAHRPPGCAHHNRYPRQNVTVIYKLLSVREWDEARARGRFEGSTVDLRDGYVHLSGRDQVVETAARHFAGGTGLVLLTVDPARLGDGLRWEASRGGALFPHLYGPLPLDAVTAADALPEGVPVPDAVARLLA
jgi:uncharacterized protein (DUF952 family)